MDSRATSLAIESTKPRILSLKTVLFVLSAALWICALVIGLTMLLRYKNYPGHAAHPPVQWPTRSRIQPVPGRATLVMLAHPHCPCTRAAIGELALLMAKCQGRVTATVLFLKPSDKPNGWEATDLWHSATRIPGVSVLGDEGGVEAAHFRATTSSQVVLYDSEGRLSFNGGITASRGHSGDNAGRSAIVSLLTGGKASRSESAVFGCPLIEGVAHCDLETGVTTNAAYGN